ncbi:MAG: hypothetical protein V4702_01740 [Patescibacteria group bacterium]
MPERFRLTPEQFAALEPTETVKPAVPTAITLSGDLETLMGIAEHALPVLDSGLRDDPEEMDKLLAQLRDDASISPARGQFSMRLWWPEMPDDSTEETWKLRVSLRNAAYPLFGLIRSAVNACLEQPEIP